MLDCPSLSTQRTKVLMDIAKLMTDASPGATPVSSARVTVPLPPALVTSVNKSTDGAVPADSRSTIMRLLLCAQWPAGDSTLLNLAVHEATALTWCGSVLVRRSEWSQM